MGTNSTTTAAQASTTATQIDEYYLCRLRHLQQHPHDDVPPRPVVADTPPCTMGKQCGWCSTTSTSQWRVGPTTGSIRMGTLCNACGINYRRALAKVPPGSDLNLDRLAAGSGHRLSIQKALKRQLKLTRSTRPRRRPAHKYAGDRVSVASLVLREDQHQHQHQHQQQHQQQQHYTENIDMSNVSSSSSSFSSLGDVRSYSSSTLNFHRATHRHSAKQIAKPPATDDRGDRRRVVSALADRQHATTTTDFDVEFEHDPDIDQHHHQPLLEHTLAHAHGYHQQQQHHVDRLMRSPAPPPPPAPPVDVALPLPQQEQGNNGNGNGEGSASGNRHLGILPSFRSFLSQLQQTRRLAA